jgi:two-component system, NtrC family, response regulator HydG
MRTTLSMLLRGAGFEVEEAEDGRQGSEMGALEGYDVVITDLRLGVPDGMGVLRAVKEAQPRSEVIVMTAYGTIESAVEAMRLGAFDYLQKPFSEQELLLKVEKALESRRLRGQIEAFAQEFKQRYGFENIVGRSEAVKNLLSRVVRIAPTDVTVLITGESGTGKELIARAVHANSKRADKPFIPINCAAITETLLESELFGHARGSFTGAQSARKGLLEEADGGTFFFDEIAETTMAFQAKLLRTIQEGEVRRVGDNRPIKVDVRVIAATNIDLGLAVEEKRFREDLYYRLNVARFKLPALRERSEDVPLLVEHFLGKYSVKMGNRVRLADGVLERLMRYEFPGNVRELENMVEQAVALSNGVITVDDIFPESTLPEEPPLSRTLAGIVDQAERKALVDALKAALGNRERAAETLGISPTTLWRKMTRLGVTYDSKG